MISSQWTHLNINFVRFLLFWDFFAAYIGSLLTTFRVNIAVLSATIKQSKTNVGEPLVAQLYSECCGKKHRGESLKSRKINFIN